VAGLSVVASESYDCWNKENALREWINATPRVAVGDIVNAAGKEPTALIFAGCSML
jgi:hypothetical protein